MIVFLSTLKRLKCHLLLLQELLDDLHPSYEHLVGNDVVPEQQLKSLNQDNGKAAMDDKLSETKDKVILDKNEEGLVPPPPPPEEKQEGKKSLDLDDIASVSFALLLPPTLHWFLRNLIEYFSC